MVPDRRRGRADVADKTEVIGLDNLRRTLNRAAREVQDLKTAPAEAAGVVVRATRAPAVTGRLAGSVRAATEKNTGIVRAGGGGVPYAGVIHWGWPRRGIRAQPFLSDAAQSSEPTWTQAYEKEVDHILSKVKGK